MGQINIAGTDTHHTPPSGSYGYGFNALGQAVKVNADGSTTLLEPTEAAAINILADLGVGLESELPESAAVGQIYVASDTMKKYTRVDSISWAFTPLVVGTFVTNVINSELFVVASSGLIVFPLPISHNELINLNVDESFQHVTTQQKELIDSSVQGAGVGDDNELIKVAADGKTASRSGVFSLDGGLSINKTTYTTPNDVFSLINLEQAKSSGTGGMRSLNIESNYTGLSDIFSMNGVRNFQKHQSEATLSWLYASLNYAYNEGGGEATNIAGVYGTGRNLVGSFNKLIGVHGVTVNETNDAANNDIYGLASSLTNNGNADQAYGVQVYQVNTGTLRENHGLQIALLGEGTAADMFGIEIGKEAGHKWQGTAENCYVMFVDASTNRGTTKSYVIFSESTAHSYLKGRLGLNVEEPTEMLDVDGNIRSSAEVHAGTKVVIENKVEQVYDSVNESLKFNFL